MISKITELSAKIQGQILSNLSKTVHVQSHLHSDQNKAQNNLIIGQKSRSNT